MNNAKEKTQTQNTFFNVTTHCCTYINDFKINENEEPSKEDELVASLAVLHGNSKSPQREYYSVIVRTEQARSALRGVWNQIKHKEHSVFASVVLSKADSSPFVFEKGEREGEMGVTHFGSLLKINLIQVDGKRVFVAENEEQEA